MGQARSWVWLQLIIGWLPVWALYTLLIVTAHPGNSLHSAAYAGLVAVALAALLGLVVQRLTAKMTWPHPMRPGFLAVHALGAVLYAVAWIGLISAVQPIIHPRAAMAVRYLPEGYFVLGVWFYVMVAGVSYAAQASERAAGAEALAARRCITRLSA